MQMCKEGDTDKDDLSFLLSSPLIATPGVREVGRQSFCLDLPTEQFTWERRC